MHPRIAWAADLVNDIVAMVVIIVLEVGGIFFVRVGEGGYLQWHAANIAPYKSRAWVLSAGHPQSPGAVKGITIFLSEVLAGRRSRIAIAAPADVGKVCYLKVIEVGISPAVGAITSESELDIVGRR